MMKRRWIPGLSVLFVVVAALVVWRLGAGENRESHVSRDVAVHVGAIRRAALRRTVTAYGTVEPEPALNGRPAAGAVITPFAGGVVASVAVAEGQRVPKGAVLLRLDSRMARAALNRARAQARVTEAAFQRQERLLTADGTSRKAYLNARAQRDVARAELAAAETELAHLNITAPLAGTVLHLDARIGAHVDGGTVLARVVDLARLVVTAAVAAGEIRGVEAGQRVILGVSDPPALGRVLVRGRDVDPGNGTCRVQISIPPDKGFMPGEFTEVHIVVEERQNVLAVPERCVVSRTGEGTWIVVVDGDQALRHPVNPGLRDRGLVEVSGEGLEEGMRVVTDEAYELPEKIRVRVIEG